MRAGVSVGAETRFRLFGAFGVESGDVELGPRDFGSRKPKQVFQLLLLAGGRPVTKDRLIDALWPGDLPRNPAATLETYVCILRHRLCGAERDKNCCIETLPGAYRAKVGPGSIDVVRFMDLLRRAERADATDALILLDEASEIADRDLLEDEPYTEWVLEPREDYKAMAIVALLDSARLSLSAGKPRMALAKARRAIQRDKACEPGYRLAAQSFIDLGQEAEARWFLGRAEKDLLKTSGLDAAMSLRAYSRGLLNIA